MSNKKIKKLCKICGNSFFVCPSLFKAYSTCSNPNCRREYRSYWSKKKKTSDYPHQIKILRERMTGKSNPNWNGGVSKDPEYTKKLYQKNKEKVKREYKKWTSENRERRTFSQRKRSYLKRNNKGDHTIEEWEALKTQYNWTCPCCRRSEPEIKLTEDHIIPLSKGGSNNIENIQPLCVSCNCSKKDKIMLYELEAREGEMTPLKPPTYKE